MSTSEPHANLSAAAMPHFQIDEATGILASMSLSWFMYQDYLIVTRSDFDVTLGEEPYIALRVLFNRKSGRFLARLWDQTVDKGRALKIEEFRDACERHFDGSRRLCLGRARPQGDEEQSLDNFVITQTPMARRFSKDCDGFLTEGCDGDLCQECDKTWGQKAVGMEEFVEVNIREEENEFKAEVDPNYTLAEEYLPDDENLETPFECEQCNKIIKGKIMLQAHQFQEHYENPELSNLVLGDKFACRVCLKLFNRNSDVKSHILRVHIGDRRFPCIICGKKFKENTHLIKHKRSHTGEKLFQTKHYFKQ